jgi:valyl-tRNA synthetase
VDYLSSGDRPKGAATAVVGAMEIYLPLEDLTHLSEERARLLKEVGKVEDEFNHVQRKLGNSEFLAKAKPEVIQKEREKANRFEEKIRALRSSLEKIQETEPERN